MAVAEPTARVFTTPWPASRGVAVYPPRITANRRQLDNRFPALGFSVDTGGLPYFEVLLATDATLFDPNNAARRAVANFYSGRQGRSPLPGSRRRDSWLCLRNAQAECDLLHAARLPGQGRGRAGVCAGSNDAGHAGAVGRTGPRLHRDHARHGARDLGGQAAAPNGPKRSAGATQSGGGRRRG